MRPDSSPNIAPSRTQMSNLYLILMSGLEDGLTLEYHAERKHGQILNGVWALTIGRDENNDIRLKNDAFVSRRHARLFCQEGQWWLEDLNSTNGSYIEDDNADFLDRRLSAPTLIAPEQPFRIGRTWLRIQTWDE